MKRRKDSSEGFVEPLQLSFLQRYTCIYIALGYIYMYVELQVYSTLVKEVKLYRKITQ